MNKFLQLSLGVLIVMGIITALILGVCAIGGAFRLLSVVFG